MIKSETNVEINVPVETVFAHLSDPMNMLEDLPSAVEVKDIKGHGKGMTYTMIYKMAGIHMSVPCEVIEYVPNKLIKVHADKMTYSHHFEATERGCRLYSCGQYEIPIPLIGKIAESLLKKTNQREWEMVVENLKARLEAKAEAAAS